MIQQTTIAGIVHRQTCGRCKEARRRSLPSCWRQCWAPGCRRKLFLTSVKLQAPLLRVSSGGYFQSVVWELESSSRSLIWLLCCSTGGEANTLTAPKTTRFCATSQLTGSRGYNMGIHHCLICKRVTHAATLSRGEMLSAAPNQAACDDASTAICRATQGPCANIRAKARCVEAYIACTRPPNQWPTRIALQIDQYRSRISVADRFVVLQLKTLK